ncbi:MAG: hypothetical protein MUD08_13240 [Cytophagales bacterium]|jgi:hypothetical protein|nr:hypothetical protein [Cytophagales bacterium]
MTIINFARLFALTVLLFGCNKLEDKTKQLSDKALNHALTDQNPDSFSIRSIVTDFQNDSTINEIKGIQTDNGFFYTDYCVYTGQKERILAGINRITLQKLNDYSSDEKSYSVDSQTFYDDIAPYEKNKHTAFFWDFEKLKTYEIYTVVKAPWRHYVIFDKHSDTVYHRIEEIRE